MEMHVNGNVLSLSSKNCLAQLHHSALCTAHSGKWLPGEMAEKKERQTPATDSTALSRQLSERLRMDVSIASANTSLQTALRRKCAYIFSQLLRRVDISYTVLEGT